MRITLISVEIGTLEEIWGCLLQKKVSTHIYEDAIRLGLASLGIKIRTLEEIWGCLLKKSQYSCI